MTIRDRLAGAARAADRAVRPRAALARDLQEPPGDGGRLEFRPGGSLWLDGREVGAWLPDNEVPWGPEADAATDLMADALVASLGLPDAEAGQ
jgi:hypothetical protein